MDVNSNKYTYIFSLIMTIVVAVVLSGASIALKDRQEANVRQEKQQSILKSIGMDLTREESALQFDNYVTEQMVIQNGAPVESETPAFEINMDDAIDASVEERMVPLYVATKNDTTFYVIPLRGKGLWGPIWGYISILEDGNTVYGTTFDHQGETPGLGAEIATEQFQDQFAGKQIMEDGQFVSIRVVKGGATGTHQVDGISGGTITSDGVDDMLDECLRSYLGFLNNRATALNEQ